MAVGYFYLAKINHHQLNFDDMVHNLKKVDTIFLNNKYVLPEIREGYNMLVQYYNQKDDYGNQLLYINRAIQLDSILHDNELFINKNIIKNYDVPKLINERDIIIKKIKDKEAKKESLIFGLFGSLLILLITLYYQHKKKKIYKKRFLEIIKASDKKVVKKENELPSTNEKDIGISQEIVSVILNELEKFEKSSLYLNNELTLSNLAKKLNTNSRYLSKIINYYKEKSFTNYINSLRVNYAVKELQENPNFRKYTFLAIANDIGFKKTETFSKAFHQEKGITPKYFLKSLNNKT